MAAATDIYSRQDKIRACNRGIYLGKPGAFFMLFVLALFSLIDRYHERCTLKAAATLELRLGAYICFESSPT